MVNLITIYNEDETPIVLIGFNNNKKEQDYTIINNFIDEIDISTLNDKSKAEITVLPAHL